MANRYPLIVDETIKEIVAGDTLVADNLLLSGTTPTLTIGDAGAEVHGNGIAAATEICVLGEGSDR